MVVRTANRAEVSRTRIACHSVLEVRVCTPAHNRPLLRRHGSCPLLVML